MSTRAHLQGHLPSWPSYYDGRTKQLLISEVCASKELFTPKPLEYTS